MVVVMVEVTPLIQLHQEHLTQVEVEVVQKEQVLELVAQAAPAL
jgi:hypothetical protein